VSALLNGMDGKIESGMPPLGWKMLYLSNGVQSCPGRDWSNQMEVVPERIRCNKGPTHAGVTTHHEFYWTSGLPFTFRL
jgi:hypothetical protein